MIRNKETERKLEPLECIAKNLGDKGKNIQEELLGKQKEEREELVRNFNERNDDVFKARIEYNQDFNSVLTAFKERIKHQPEGMAYTDTFPSHLERFTKVCLSVPSLARTIAGIEEFKKISYGDMPYDEYIKNTIENDKNHAIKGNAWKYELAFNDQKELIYHGTLPTIKKLNKITGEVEYKQLNRNSSKDSYEYSDVTKYVVRDLNDEELQEEIASEKEEIGQEYVKFEDFCLQEKSKKEEKEIDSDEYEELTEKGWVLKFIETKPGVKATPENVEAFRNSFKK